jgi:hypothetical protein
LRRKFFSQAGQAVAAAAAPRGTGFVARRVTDGVSACYEDFYPRGMQCARGEVAKLDIGYDDGSVAVCQDSCSTRRGCTHMQVKYTYTGTILGSGNGSVPTSALRVQEDVRRRAEGLASVFTMMCYLYTDCGGLQQTKADISQCMWTPSAPNCSRTLARVPCSNTTGAIHLQQVARPNAGPGCRTHGVDAWTRMLHLGSLQPGRGAWARGGGVASGRQRVAAAGLAAEARGAVIFGGDVPLCLADLETQGVSSLARSAVVEGAKPLVYFPPADLLYLDAAGVGVRPLAGSSGSRYWRTDLPRAPPVATAAQAAASAGGAWVGLAMARMSEGDQLEAPVSVVQAGVWQLMSLDPAGAWPLGRRSPCTWALGAAAGGATAAVFGGVLELYRSRPHKRRHCWRTCGSSSLMGMGPARAGRWSRRAQHGW